MTSQLDADRVLEDWLAQGPSQLPERAIHETIGRLDSVRQRKPSRLPGSERMNRPDPLSERGRRRGHRGRGGTRPAQRRPAGRWSARSRLHLGATWIHGGPARRPLVPGRAPRHLGAGGVLRRQQRCRRRLLRGSGLDAWSATDLVRLPGLPDDPGRHGLRGVGRNARRGDRSGRGRASSRSAATNADPWTVRRPASAPTAARNSGSSWSRGPPSRPSLPTVVVATRSTCGPSRWVRRCPRWQRSKRLADDWLARFSFND